VVSLAERGLLRIPLFQRSFVWDTGDVRALFDSIWRGFPIGTLLLWKHPAEAGRVAFGPFELDAPKQPEALWVVDGQQRVSTLVGALSPQAQEVDPIFEVCFDLRRARFVHATRRPQPHWWLPVRVTLESRTLLGWLRDHGEDLSADELDLADAVGGALRDYTVPAYIVEHDDDELLREVFDRVNSAGKPISRAQVFHALFGGTAPTASASAVVESLSHEGFGALDEQRVVQSLLAIRGGDVQRDLHDEFAEDEDRERWFDDTERALSRVIAFLKREGVPHLLLVPSTFPIPVLAAYFHLHPDADPWIERLLARWVWRGWLHGFGRGGQTPALRQAVRAVHPVKCQPQKAPSAYDAVQALISSVSDDEPTISDLNLQTNSAVGRLVLLALASLKPLSGDGTPIDLAHALDEHGVAAITALVPGHRATLAARGFWPVEAGLPSGREDSTVLASHALDAGAAQALRNADIEQFVADRGRRLTVLANRYVSEHVQSGALVRPPLDELLVEDVPLDEVE
jgi:hypothetical protein